MGGDLTTLLLREILAGTRISLAPDPGCSSPKLRRAEMVDAANQSASLVETAWQALLQA
jgi:hypothetical protein